MEHAGPPSEVVPLLDLGDLVHTLHPARHVGVRLERVSGDVVCDALGEVAKLGQELQVSDRGLVPAEEGAAGGELLGEEAHELGQLLRQELLAERLDGLRLLRPLRGVPVVRVLAAEAHVQRGLPGPREVVREAHDLLDLQHLVGVGGVERAAGVELARHPAHHCEALRKALRGAVVLRDLHQGQLAVGHGLLQRRPVLKADAVVLKLRARHDQGEPHLLGGGLDVEVGQLNLRHGRRWIPRRLLSAATGASPQAP
mmetsp:Transcript_118029/g.314047  ORF Transcript_118029/g.314047 Transcript_118029/m.314047 type:complete len:256 (+) Transcript_118029:77-844(+)